MPENSEPGQDVVKLAGNLVSIVGFRINTQESRIDILFSDELVIEPGKDLAIELR